MEVELDVNRDHTEQEAVIKTTLYEPRGKSRYRGENVLGDKQTHSGHHLGHHSIHYSHGQGTSMFPMTGTGGATTHG